MTNKSLTIEPKLCTGCQRCELACSFHHTGAFNPARARIRVFEFEHGAHNVPYTCTQCAEAWCARVCPVAAISVNAGTGAWEVAAEICVGCKACTQACPFGTVTYEPQTSKVVKCDLCGGAPQCVQACPTGAITYLPHPSAGLARMRDFAAKSLPGHSAET